VQVRDVRDACDGVVPCLDLSNLAAAGQIGPHRVALTVELLYLPVCTG
jgi:hypothetical protein